MVAMYGKLGVNVLKKIISLSVFMIVTMLCISIRGDAQWKQTRGPSSGYITCLSAYGDTLYAGTYAGLYMSTNKGQNWSSINSGLEGNLIFTLLKSGANLVTAAYYGNFMSTDDGKNWWGGNDPPKCLLKLGSVIFSAPSHFQTILRSTNDGEEWLVQLVKLDDSPKINSLIGVDSILFAGTNKGVFFSNDLGVSWTVADSGLINYNIFFLASIGNNVCASTDSGIFLSSDNGISWNRTNNELDGKDITCLAAQGTTCYAGTTDGIYYSLDSCITWKSTDSTLKNTYITSITSSGSDLYVGTSLGEIYKTSNNGVSWESLKLDFRTLDIYGFGVVSSNLITNGLFEGVYLTSDKGESWVHSNTGIGNAFVSALLTLDADIYACTYKRLNSDMNAQIIDGKVCVSHDSGTTWTSANFELDSNKIVLGLTAVDSVLFAFTLDSGNYVSTDKGKNWLTIDKGINFREVIRLGNNLTAIDNSLKNYKVYKSIDNGIHWELVSSVPKGIYLHSMINLGDYLLAGSSEGFYFSIDSGYTWEQVNNQLKGEQVVSIVTSGKYLFAASYIKGKVYMSTDRGISWIDVSIGLPDTTIQKLKVFNNDLYVGLEGRSVWKRPLSEMIPSSVSRQDHTIKFIQNSPNPFRTLTTISFNLAKRDFVTLDIYDLLGHRIKRLLNKVMDSGLHDIKFDGAGLPKGAYVINLVTSNGQRQHKIIYD
jgi:photosystem II stability/assembly factor-like uncharacterized protein